MYWYKPAHIRLFILYIAFIICGLYSCKPDIKDSRLKFFDLDKYFKAEAVRLSASSPVIAKSVMHNGIAESKKISIKNWESELDLFITSNINKPAWRESYSVVDDGSIAIYTAIKPELKTRKIMIKKEGTRVKWIMIFNHTENLLYKSSEKLSYFPDSLYQVYKKQQVRLLGENNYKIEGFFKR
ncbi:MAG: hypothetical protein EOP47_24800 [Sphingobacteriaceae bacterium]|nr:MAG: hypothetical protein EOP47_24800 [Sphingobacteriaceae bacterium]